MTRPIRIAELTPHADWTFLAVANDGRVGQFDLRPYLQYEAFEELNDITEFMKVKNGGYFAEWECSADLSADTIEAKQIMRTTCNCLAPLNGNLRKVF